MVLLRGEQDSNLQPTVLETVALPIAPSPLTGLCRVLTCLRALGRAELWLKSTTWTTLRYSFVLV